MGQKVNPIGIRLGIVSREKSVWYEKEHYADRLNSDLKIREYLEGELKNAGISSVRIERLTKNAVVTVFVARPGVIIGKKGADVEVLQKKLSRMMGVSLHLNIESIRKPDLDAKLVSENVAQQLERRVLFRKAMKRAVQNTMRAGALGVKLRVSGRLGGAEIARTEWSGEGKIPLHTFRADIDYNVAEAKTAYGIIGVKVWIFRGEKLISRGLGGQDKKNENIIGGY